jgi:MFS transporter, DHA2 family, methylenomycin A resistance protein
MGAIPGETFMNAAPLRVPPFDHSASGVVNRSASAEVLSLTVRRLPKHHHSASAYDRPIAYSFVSATMQHKAPGFALVVGTTSLAFVVVQLDVTIVNVALPRIATELSANVAALQWIVDAYTLAFSVFMLSGGALGDRFGSRRGFVAGLTIFALASLACALARDAGALITARAWQGLGAAAMLPNSLALLNHAYSEDPERRAHAIGWWTAAGSISIAAGPVLGGLLLDVTNWRAIFFVNLPLCALGMLLATRLPETERHAHRHRLDVGGQLTATLALTALTAGVIEVRTLGVAHPLIWGGFALAVTAGVAFVMIETRVAAPMIALDLFANRTFNTAVGFGMIVNFTYYGTVFVLTLYLQRALGYPAMRAGLAFLPLTAGFFVSNVVSGRLTAALGPRVPMLLGAAIDVAGFALLQHAGPGTSYANLWLPFLLIPTGMGLAVPAMTNVILSSVDKRRAGTASAVLNTARQASGAMGVAVYGALADGAAARIVQGLHVATMISTALLIVGGALVLSMRPRALRTIART